MMTRPEVSRNFMRVRRVTEEICQPLSHEDQMPQPIARRQSAQVALGPHQDSESFHQMLGDVWEWTGNAYLPYPDYRRVHGPFGEYNGKFMVNQMVLRGGSCATSEDHIRITYRNFSNQINGGSSMAYDWPKTVNE